MKAIYHSETGDVQLEVLENKDGKLALATEDGTVKVEGCKIGTAIGTASLVVEQKPIKVNKAEKEPSNENKQ